MGGGGQEFAGGWVVWRRSVVCVCVCVLVGGGILFRV
jgi:hypothetical protein